MLFINVSRGEISPLQDVRRLLDERILAGAGLDVYAEEQAVADYLRSKSGPAPDTATALLALQDDERVLCTPHNAFNTREALERKAQLTSEAILAFLNSGRFPHPLPDQ
jgi:D-lactate dehydrogenase